MLRKWHDFFVDRNLRSHDITDEVCVQVGQLGGLLDLERIGYRSDEGTEDEGSFRSARAQRVG